MINLIGRPYSFTNFLVLCFKVTPRMSGNFKGRLYQIIITEEAIKRVVLFVSYTLCHTHEVMQSFIQKFCMI